MLALAFAPNGNSMNTKLAILYLLGASPLACSSTVTGTGQPPGDKGAADGTSGNGGNAGNAGGAGKRIFVTSQTYNGALQLAVPRSTSGLAAADALCQLAADGAELRGKFKAYLADTTRGPSDDLADVGPWFSVSNRQMPRKVFNNKANLSTAPLSSFNQDEFGADVVGLAWTGVGGSNCANWTSSSSPSSSSLSDGLGSVGQGGAPSGAWRTIANDRFYCSDEARLYCLEQ